MSSHTRLVQSGLVLGVRVRSFTPVTTNKICANSVACAKRMPLTYASMLLCTAAISGVPFLSGFYSKDAILGFAADTWSQGAGPAAYLPLALLALAAPLTALYMFRMFLLTFSGEARSEHAAQAKEVPLPMSVPLILLGLGAVFGSLLWIAHPHPSESGHSTATLLAGVSLVIGLGAALLYFQFKKASPSSASAALGPFARAGAWTLWSRRFLPGCDCRADPASRSRLRKLRSTHRRWSGTRPRQLGDSRR